MPISGHYEVHAPPCGVLITPRIDSGLHPSIPQPFYVEAGIIFPILQMGVGLGEGTQAQREVHQANCRARNTEPSSPESWRGTRAAPSPSLLMESHRPHADTSTAHIP